MTSPYSDARVRNAIGFLHLANGDLPRLKEAAERACADATALGQELTTAWAHYLLGRVYYEWNELADAEAHFAAVHAVRHKCHFMLLRNAMHGLALTQQARGRSDAAAQTLATLRAWVAQLRDGGQLAIEQAFAARLALLRGDLALAERWLRVRGAAGAPRGRTGGGRSPADARPGAARPAGPRRRRARRRRRAPPSSRSTRRSTRPSASSSCSPSRRWRTRRSAPRPPRWTRSSARCSLAEPAGRVRVFVDLGPPMGRLLALYAARRGTSPYLARLLAACGTTPAAWAPTPPNREVQPFQMVEPLTRRELEVLQRLQMRRTNDEIARALYVSVDTVKKHTKNLYQKLQVDGRRHAVAQAIVLGLLPPSPAVEPDDSALASA